MKLDLQLYIRRHRNGFFTVRVLGDHPLELYTDDLDQAREDLELVVSDLIDRSHPRRQSAFSLAGNAEADVLDVPELLTVHGEREADKQPVSFTVLVSGSTWRDIWLPRLDLHVFSKSKRKAWQDDAATLVRKHLDRLSEGEQLAVRRDPEEWVESLSISADPPPLTRFVGRYRNLDQLPVAADEARDAAAAPTPGGKPPRPPTPTFTRIGVDLRELAQDGELERAFERTSVVEDLEALINGTRKQGIAVVGPSGVGKSTVLNEVAHRIAHATEDPKAARPIFFADASRLVAGENWFGDWQRQTLDVLEECEASDVVWYVGELLPLLDAGKNIASEQNVAMLLKPALAGRRVTVVGECSAATWSQLSLRDAGFARLFTVFRIEEPDEAEANRILERLAGERASSLGIHIPPDALVACVELARRYASDGSSVGNAAHLLRRVADAAAADDLPRIDRAAVVRHFCTESGLPDFLVRDELPLPIDRIRAAFDERLIGQDHAVALMTDLIAVIKAGLSDLGRPLGSFLFVGPTGVGKTETAKALAGFLFGSDQRLTRFDMSEFAGWDAVTRFLGSKEEEGKLVSAVRQRPFSVVLLDEIEKASPAIFDVLLQVLGEARLSDESGRTADFKNVVVIMTSNLGVDTLKRGLGFQASSAAERYQSHFTSEAQKFFRPELFNRIDHVVPFTPLADEAIQKITSREVSKLVNREGLRQRDLELSIDDDVLVWLAERGVDERYGARPLKRVLEQQLAAPLARQLASGYPDGTRTIAVSVDGSALAFEAQSRRTSTGTDAKKLEPLISRVQSLRFRHRSWRDHTAFREAEQRLRLLERLSQSKSFWSDKSLADARLVGIEDDRRLVEAMTEIGRRIESLDDLAHDAFFSRDTSSADDLETERIDIVSALADEELAIHGRDLPDRDAIALFFTPGHGAERFLERLVTLYADFAHEKSWTLTANILFLDPSLSTDGAPEDRKTAKSRRQKKDEPPPPVRKRNALKEAGKTAKLRWRLTQPKSLEPESDDTSLRRAVDKFIGRAQEDDTIALFVVGRHAATMLVEESGQHHRIADDHMSLVTVRTRPGADVTPPRPEFLLSPAVKTRVVDERRGLIDDVPLRLHFPVEPRLWRVYERFMRARPFRRAFGALGIRWFRQWEAE